jgi:hypothetical protein
METLMSYANPGQWPANFKSWSQNYHKVHIKPGRYV